jgi:FkbM family methyltransferase
MDLIGNALRKTPSFRGKWRIQRLWERTLRPERRLAQLPDGSVVEVDMDIPYERMVWLQSEEWNELRYLQYRLHKNETFVDVGANIGIWTLVAASAVGSVGHVFSFEPNPNTFRKLNANIARNGRAGVVSAHQKAVSRANGLVSFACPTQHNLSAIVEDETVHNTITVPSVSLDSALQGVSPAGMKLDTEGHELASLQGAVRIINDSSPWLIIEFNTTLLQSPVLRDWPVHQFLASFGYKPFTYHGPGEATPIDDEYAIQGYRNILFERRA